MYRSKFPTALDLRPQLREQLRPPRRFLYQDYGKWRKAENPEYPAPADAEKLNISESIEENYISGNATCC